MRPSIRAFVETCVGCLDLPDPVYEFGAYRAAGLEQLADMRPLFPGRAYVGTDMREGPGVDRVIDLHAIDLPDGSVGTALVLDTMEHVRDPHRAVAEIHRVLRQDGVLVISSVMSYPIHAAPDDYWRFTPQGLASLLEPFADAVVEFAGAERLPISVVGVAFNSAPAPDRREELASQLAGWSRRVEPRWKSAVRLVSPPALLIAGRRVLGVRGL